MIWAGKSDNVVLSGWEKKTAGLYEKVINRLKDILYDSHYIIIFVDYWA